MTAEILPFQVDVRRDGEPRVSDVEMAQRLGYPDIKVFRRLIREHEENLKEINQVSWEPIALAQGGGRTGRAFWLTEAQALFMISRSDMPHASRIMIEVSRAFVAYNRRLHSEPQLVMRAFLLASDARPWKQEYSERFWSNLHRVGGWRKPAGNNHSLCSHFINKYVYLHLLGQLGMQVIRDANPAKDGERAHKHHSMLKAEHMPVLRRHIERVEDILINSTTLGHFEDAFNRTFPKPETQIGFLFREVG